MPNKIKIIMSLNSLGLGGNVIFVMNFFRHIDKEKFQVDFMIYDDTKMDFYEEVKANGSNVFAINGSDYKSRKREILSVLNKENYDIIHINSCSFKGLFKTVLPVSSQKGKIKIIAHSHNPGTPRNTILDTMERIILKRLLTSKIDYGFACSQESGESKFTPAFLKSNRFYIINNAIDSEKFRFQENVRNILRSQLGIEKNFVIGSVGRLEAQKNYLFFIDVLKKFIEIVPQTVFLLVGTGSQMQELKKKTSEYHLEKNVIFVGKARDAERYYQAMDVFVLPSIYEGFGFVNIEAQVSGLPCVVSDRVPETVDISGKISFVPLDIDQWVQALQIAIKSSGERKTCSTKKYDLKSETKRLEKIYCNLLKKRGQNE